MIRLLRGLQNALGWYRFARYLAEHRIPFLPGVIDRVSRTVFACWIPHSAKIGKNVTLGYGGLGIVIHADAIIGDNVEIGQEVTLGGNSHKYGVPEIGDGVFIGCGAKILGPIKVGPGVVIGANSVVVHDVPARCVVAGIPARIIREGIDTDEYLWHRRVRYSQRAEAAD